MFFSSFHVKKTADKGIKMGSRIAIAVVALLVLTIAFLRKIEDNKKLGILKGIPELCHDNNMFACALTDTNMMSGCAEFSDVMPSSKLQPIIGVELSINHHMKKE